MTNRRRLPDRRASENFALECDGLRISRDPFHASPIGRLAEIFLSHHKAEAPRTLPPVMPRLPAALRCNSAPTSRQFAKRSVATRGAIRPDR